MQRSGGYILHLDATHEGDAPALMTGMDGISRIVLANVKVPSEHADHIAPFLRQLQSDYGAPIACVHDMGTGICKAVAQVFPDTRDFICNEKGCLEQLFAEVETNFCTYALKLNPDTDQILPGFSKLLRIETLPDRVIQLAMNGHVSGKSN